MPDLEIREVATYEEFVREWHSDELEAADLDETRDRIDEETTRLLWQLLGQLAADELLIQIPAWLAEEKSGYVEGAPPTELVGRVERETEKAILVGDSAAARALLKLAHRIHELERTEADPDRNEWLDDRLAAHRRAFQRREDVPQLADEWLPKSQLQHVVRRRH